MSEKKQVKDFKKKYKIKKIDSDVLIDILNKQGYTVVEFNGIDDTEDVTEVVDALNLAEYIRVNRCFTYFSDKHRLVFINENLNEDEKTVVLAHEQGHIWNGHFSSKSVIGHDVMQEYQANEFEHYLLKDKSADLRKKRRIICICLLVVSFVIGLYWFIEKKREKAIYTDDFYRTESGTKYHIKECMYIKDKTDVYRLTKEEFDSGIFEPCEACMPDRREYEE